MANDDDDDDDFNDDYDGDEQKRERFLFAFLINIFSLKKRENSFLSHIYFYASFF